MFLLTTCSGHLHSFYLTNPLSIHVKVKQTIPRTTHPDEYGAIIPYITIPDTFGKFRINHSRPVPETLIKHSGENRIIRNAFMSKVM